MAKRKQAMPSYYGKNIAQNAQRKALKRLEAERAARAEARRNAAERRAAENKGN